MTLRPLRNALVGAAAMLAFCVGTVAVFGTAQRGVHGLTLSIPLGAANIPAGEEYMLLLYSGSNPSGIVTADQIKARVTEYGVWAKELDRQGLLVAAEKLDSSDSQLMRRSEGDLQFDPVSADADGAVPPRLTGFFHIRAESGEHAQRIAAQSPHLNYGGRIGIRRIEKTN